MAAAAKKSHLLLALFILLAVPAAVGGPGRALAADEFTVTSTFPVDGQTVSGVVAWTATVSGGPVHRVEFYVDGKLLGTERNPPYDRSWDTTKAAPGTHVLKLRAVRTDGLKVSSEFRVTVGTASGGGGDATPPSAPAGLKATSASTTSFGLSWSPSTDNVAVAGYGIYLNGSLVGKTASTSYLAGNLVCGTSYTFAVDAFDAAQNRSSASSFMGSTAACPVSPPPSSDGSLYLSPTGSDSGSCTSALPCRSLDRAYRVAKPGQVVEVAGGTYPGQTVGVDSTKTSTDDVAFKPAADASVVFSGAVLIKGKHLEFRDMKLVPKFETTASDVTFRNVSIPGAFDIMSNGTAYPTEISFIGGDIGPSPDKNVRIGSNGYSTSASPTKILFDGVRFHDFRRSPGSSVHVECLQVWAATGLTIRNSRFENCEVFDIFLQKLPNGAAPTPSNIVIENNVLDCCGSGYYSIRLSDTHGESWKNVTLRNNSSNKAFNLAPNVPYSNVHVLSNVAPKLDGTPAGATVDYNVWYAGRKVGANDQVAPHGFADISSLDLRLLAGAAAIDRGHPTNHPPTDFEGDGRPSGVAPDAGADELVGVTAPDSPPEEDPDPEEPPATSGESLYVTTGGSDAGECTATAPCRTLSRAYKLARPGHAILMSGGSYPAQTIQVDSTKSAPAVVVKPAAGADVTVGSLDIYGSHVEVQNIRVEPRWYVYEGATQVTMRNIRAERFVIASASNVSVIGGDYGPSIDSVSAIKTAYKSTTPPRNILVDGVYVHDVNRPAGTDFHRECLHVMAADGLTIRNSKFHRCLHIGISFNEHGDADVMRGITVENNWIGFIDGHHAINLSAGDPCEILIRFNTFRDKGIAPSCPQTGRGVRIESNIFPSMGSHICGENGYSWNWNVYESGVKCGPNDLVAPVDYVDRTGFDLRLRAGTAAIDRGNSASHPATDLFSRSRPAGGAPDAGAHEAA